MFFYLSKILAFLLNPLVWIFFLLIVGLILKNLKIKRILFIISFLSLYLFSNSFFVDECMRWYEYTSKDFKENEKYEWAVVLGGMINYDERLDKPQFNKSADRIFQVLPLWKNGNVKKIVISGGSGSISKPSHKEAQILKNYLLKIGIPDSVLFVEKESKNTRENALFTKNFFAKNKINSQFLLITSAFHMPRAKACFEKVGLKNIRPFCTDRYSGVRKFEWDHCFIPNADALATFTLFIHELSGYIIYWMVDYR